MPPGLEFPKTREDAAGGPFEEMWKTPGHWPRNVRRLTVDDMGMQGVDPKTGSLYWDGVPVVTERRFSNVERLIAIGALVLTAVGVAATVVQAWAAVAALP